ncbi:MAG TPA: TIGR02186 family protein [Candidatus Sulfotelmatobacter sp.]|nr:TIGR02186 family protein [Candidatus Sulfotelmatobacter sp.]
MFLLTASPVRAGVPLVADLSNHLLAITTGFAGASVLLFGAVEDDGDVVVVVRGPAEPEVIRRKERFLGIWINKAQAVVNDAPVYYRVASTKPLDEIAAAAVLDRQQIGLDHLKLTVRRKDKAVEDQDYRAALLRLKAKAGLYGAETGQVAVMAGRLFRTEMDFPANVPTGTYQVEVYLFKSGEVVTAQTTPLIVGKIGIGAEVFDFANRQAALYGLMAVILAVAAGWLAAVAFRKS